MFTLATSPLIFTVNFKPRSISFCQKWTTQYKFEKRKLHGVQLQIFSLRRNLLLLLATWNAYTTLLFAFYLRKAVWRDSSCIIVRLSWNKNGGVQHCHTHTLLPTESFLSLLHLEANYVWISHKKLLTLLILLSMAQQSVDVMAKRQIIECLETALSVKLPTPQI